MDTSAPGGDLLVHLQQVLILHPRSLLDATRDSYARSAWYLMLLSRDTKRSRSLLLPGSPLARKAAFLFAASHCCLALIWVSWAVTAASAGLYPARLHSPSQGDYRNYT